MNISSARLETYRPDGTSLLFVIVLFLACFIIATTVPSFQSPDEPDHVKRAYLLGKGQIVLTTPAGQASGGQIDTGLLAYMAAFTGIPFHPEQKIAREPIEDAERIVWSGIKQQIPAPGTGYYFPVIYAPQAVGLAVGETLGWTVGESYRLARLLALLASCLLLLLAFGLHRPPLLALALLTLPMSMFQMSAASLDGISNAVAVLTVSLFLRMTRSPGTLSSASLWGLALCVLIVTSSRVHLLPLIALVFASFLYTKHKSSLYAGGLVTLLVLAWLTVVIKTTVDTRVITGLPTGSLITYYLGHPMALARVLAATASSTELQHFYQRSFIGILGWLDAPFAASTYTTCWLLLLLVLPFSVTLGAIRQQPMSSAVLLLAALGAVFLVFFALLITWNVHPAEVIQGVQGRYFFAPAMMLAYAFGSNDGHGQKGLMRAVGLAVVATLFLYGVSQTGRLLVSRYYIVDEIPATSKMALTPSPQLTKGLALPLAMDESQTTAPQALTGLGVFLGTYARANPGIAVLQLRTKDGLTLQIPFELASLEDNQYRFFKLDGQPYVSADLLYQTGGGISVWQTQPPPGVGASASCLMYAATNGTRRTTRGCPSP